MITIKKETSTLIREAVAAWEFVDNDGKLQSEDIRVLYRDWSTADLKSQQNAAKTEGNEDWIWNTDSLLKRLHSLPDLVDEKGKPVEITLEFLDSQSVKNIANLKKAIDEDLNPEKK